MDDKEFDVLDELYFIKNYDELTGVSDLDEAELTRVLRHLLEKRWIKMLNGDDTEIPYRAEQFQSDIKQYNFIATKAGLLAHNGR